MSILTLVAICLSVFSVITSFTSAQSPALTQDCSHSNICSAPPATFRLMTSFMQEMILAIKTVGTRDPYVGKYVSPSRFDAGQFNPPKEGLVDKLTQNIRQKLDSLLAVGAIFTDLHNFGGLKDFAGGLIVLVKKKLFLRDYKTLMSIDDMINTKEYELGLGGGWSDELNDANRKMFQNILDKYGPNGEGLFTDGTKISQSATYKQIVLLAMRINSSLKTFLASPNLTITPFLSGFTRTKLFSDTPDIQITFNQKMIAAMKADYQCAGTVKCDTSMSKFVANITKISKNFGSGATDARKTIQDASKRLAVAMRGGGSGATQDDKDAVQKRQQELLRTQFGLKTAQINSGGLFGLKNYRQMILDAGGKISDGWKAMTQDLRDNNQRAALFTGAGMTTSEKIKAAKDVKIAIDAFKSTRGANLNSQETSALNIADALGGNIVVDVSQYADIQASMDTVYADAAAMNQSALIADNVDVTYPFSQVFQVMRNTIDHVIGNRNTDDSLIKNLGEACKAQCANAGGDCFN